MRGVRNGPFEGDPHFHVFHVSFFISLFLFLKKKQVSGWLCFLVFLSNMFLCWRLYQSLTVDVFSVVGAPRRCGVVNDTGRDSWDWAVPPTWKRA